MPGSVVQNACWGIACLRVFFYLLKLAEWFGTVMANVQGFVQFGN